MPVVIIESRKTKMVKIMKYILNTECASFQPIHVNTSSDVGTSNLKATFPIGQGQFTRRTGR